MNKKTIVVSALLGVLAGKSVMAMEQEKKAATWYDTVTSGKALTAAVVVGGGGYVAAMHSDKVASVGKLGYLVGKAYGEAGLEYAKANPRKVATYTAASALGAYGLYKLYNRKSTAESKVAGPALNPDDLFVGAEGSKHQQDALENVPVWFSQLFVVLKEVYGEDQASIKSFLNKVKPNDAYAFGNPHVLLQDTKLLGKMGKAQKAQLFKVQLFNVCCSFTTEYIVDSVNKLAGMLAKDQGLIRDMLGVADVVALINMFNELTSPDFGLTEEQTTLVKNTNEFVQECFLGQKFFCEDHGIKA